MILKAEGGKTEEESEERTMEGREEGIESER